MERVKRIRIVAISVALVALLALIGVIATTGIGQSAVPAEAETTYTLNITITNATTNIYSDQTYTTKWSVDSIIVSFGSASKTINGTSGSATLVSTTNATSIGFTLTYNGGTTSATRLQGSRSIGNPESISGQNTECSYNTGYPGYINYTGNVYYNASTSSAITKENPTVTAPTAKSNLTYTGSAQALVNAGSTTGGTLQYNVDGGAWGTSVPTGTNAKTSYSVGYKVVGNDNYNDVAAQYINVSIAKANNPLSFTSTQSVNKTFSTSSQTASLTAATSGQGTVTYAINSQKNSSNATVSYFTLSGTTLTIAASTPAGTYTVVVRASAAGNDNYNSGTKDSTVTVTVNRADIDPSVTMSGWTYGQAASEPSVSGNTGNGGVTYQYKVSSAGDGTYTSTTPTDAGTYTVKATVAQTTNYNSGSATTNFTIAKANNPLAFTSTQDVNKSYSSSSQTATLTAATNGQGAVTYVINSQKNSSDADVAFFSISGTTLNIAANTPLDTYTLVVRATAEGNGNYNSGTKESTVTVTILHVHNALEEFAPWVLTDSMPADPGSYCLVGDVTISSTWTVPTGATNLCLNGHGIKLTGTGSVVFVGSGCTLNIYDCEDTVHYFDIDNSGKYAININETEGSGRQSFTGGYITGSNGANASGIEIDSGAVNMYAGTIIGNVSTNDAGGVNCYDYYGAFNMEGGAIIYNRANRYGGGVYCGTNGAVTIKGGSISNNVCGTNGGGIYAATSFSVLGTFTIENNKNGNYQNNVYLCWQCDIILLDEINPTAEIGVTLSDATEHNGSAENGQNTFTSGWMVEMAGEDYNDYFVSDYGYNLGLRNSEVKVVQSKQRVQVTSYGLVHTYTDLPSACGGAGDTLLLIDDIEYIAGKDGSHENNHFTINRNVTIDLNGHTMGRYNDDSPRIILSNNAVLTIDDTSGTPGGWYNCAFTANGDSHVILRNMRTNNVNVFPIGYGQLYVDDGYVAKYINNDKSPDSDGFKLLVQPGDPYEIVIALIEAIGTVTHPDSRDKIEAAREAYDNLSSEQKALVTNYSDLTDAEDTFALLHVFTDATYVAEVPADCVTDGIAAHYECTCGYLFTTAHVKTTADALVIPKLNNDPEPHHTYGSLIAEVPATCTESGVAAHYECSVCHKLFIYENSDYVEVTADELVIAALGHTYGSLVAEVPATCTTAGVAAHYHCSECGHYFDSYYSETTYGELSIPAFGHDFSVNCVGATITAVCSHNNCPLDNGTATLTIYAPNNLIYNGSTKEATLNAYDDSVFTYVLITYQKHNGTACGDIASCVNTGDYKAIVTATVGGGQYTAYVTFTIDKAANPIAYDDQNFNKTYSVTQQTIDLAEAANSVGAVTYEITSQDDNSGPVTYFTLDNTTLTVAAGTPADTYFVVVRATAIGNDNYSAGPADSIITVVVGQASNPIAFANQSADKTFSTSSQTATLVAATDGQGTVTYTILSQEGTSGAVEHFSINGTTLTMASNTPVDTYTVVVRAHAEGNDNYLAGNAESTVTVTVAQANNTITYINSQSVAKNYNASSQEAVLAEAENNVGAVTYAIHSQEGTFFTLSNTTLTIAENTPAGTYTVVVRATAEGNGNYLAGYADSTVTVTIGKADPAFVAPTDLNATYGDDLASVELPEGWAWTNNDKVGNAGEVQHDATFTPADTDNYNALTFTLTVVVAKANPAYVVPTGIESPVNVKISTVGLPEGFSWMDGNIDITNFGEKTYSAKFTPSDTANYNVVENIDVKVLVKWILVDPTQNDVTITIGDGDDQYDINVTLKVEVKTEVTAEEKKGDYKEIGKKFVEKNEDIAGIYDVKLIRTTNGVEEIIQPSDIKPGTKVTVAMRIPDMLVGKNFRILHIHSADDVAEVKDYTVTGDIVKVQADRLSEFAFIVTMEDEQADNGFDYRHGFCLGWGVVIVDIVAAAFFVVYMLLRRRRLLSFIGLGLSGAALAFAIATVVLHLCVLSIIGVALAGFLFAAYLVFFFIGRKIAA